MWNDITVLESRGRGEVGVYVRHITKGDRTDVVFVPFNSIKEHTITDVPTDRIKFVDCPDSNRPGIPARKCILLAGTNGETHIEDQISEGTNEMVSRLKEENRDLRIENAGLKQELEALRAGTAAAVKAAQDINPKKESSPLSWEERMRYLQR